MNLLCQSMNGEEGIHLLVALVTLCKYFQTTGTFGTSSLDQTHEATAVWAPTQVPNFEYLQPRSVFCGSGPSSVREANWLWTGSCFIMESMSNTQKNRWFHLISKSDERDFTVAILSSCCVSILCTWQYCISNRRATLSVSSGRQHSVVISLLIVQQSAGTVGHLLV